MNRLPEGERRRVATEATLARYRGKVFDWQAGVTCGHLLRAHLRNMGHRPPPLPRYRSPLGVQKALRQLGLASVEEWLDSLQLPRIAPAQMVLGDVGLLRGEGGLDAIFICAGPRKVFGWRDDEPALVMLDVGLDELSGAWRG